MDVSVQILNIAGLICEFLAVFITAQRVFWKKEKAKEEEIKRMGKTLNERIQSAKDLQSWVLALLLAALVFQIIAVLIG